MEDNIPGPNDRGSEDGLKWQEIFERTDVINRGNVLRSLLVNQLYNGAVSSYEIVNTPLLGISIREQYVQNLILSPIEWFLFGGEPCHGRQKLLEINNPPTLCGKIFKNGEPTYSCRDCALDATCVLCMQCFGKSIHKDHNYQLSTSSGGGGGCCDCGDLEAWKKGASCELHTAIPGNSAEGDLLKKLPEEFFNRAKCLISILLDFCVNVICHPNDEELLPELKLGIASSDNYATVLFNDESHTFDGVISGLTKAISGCTERMALDFANVVDREGRSIIFEGNFESCDQVRISVEHSTATTAQNSHIGALRCETLNLHLIACQLIALRLMKWLSELTEQSDYLRMLHSSLCTNEFAGKSQLTNVLLADAQLWKAARFQTHQLLMNTLLRDPQGKVSFGTEFAKNYAALMNDFYADDQEHSISATVMSVQLFTVPSLVQSLVVNFDLLEVVIQVLLDRSSNFVGDNGVFDFQKDKLGKMRRLHYVVHDLRYILQNKQSGWNEVLKEKYLRFLELFLSFYRRFHEMDRTKRATGNHIEIEPEWHKSFTFQLNIAEILPLILKWSKSDRDVLLRSVSVTLKCLKDIRRKTGVTKLKKHQEGKKTMKTFDFDVSSNHISINIAIVRFLAGLIEACEMYSISIPDLLEVKKDDDLLMYLEYPLKVLAMVAQIKAGMWKRNGYSLQNQAVVYQKDLSREMYDKDIFLMQAIASCMDKDHFIVVLLDMFKLLPWSLPNYDVDEMQPTLLNQQLSVAGEFLRLLIIILGERYKCSVGQVNANSHLQRHVIHKLCLGTMPRSQLMQGLPLFESECNHGSGIDEVILSVATFRKPGLSSKGMYTLKREYLGEFNPFFYHYTKNEQSKAEDCHRKRCKEEGIPAVFVPPVPVQFSPVFANIVDLLSCQKLVELLTIILWKIKRDNPRSWTDRIFHEVLHLIGLALHEETRKRENQESFGFLKAARKRQTNVCKYSLIECLEALQDNPAVEGYGLLLRWTIKKFNDEISARENPGRQQPAHVETVEEVKRDEEKMLKQRLAKERRERVLRQMSNMQREFIRENSELYLSTNLDDPESDFPDAAAISVPVPSSVPVIAIGKNRTLSVFIPEEQFTCILCQEKPTTKSGVRPLVCSAYVQRSKNLSTGSEQPVEEGDDADPLVAHRDQRVGVHTSSCGHVMHGECWKRFLESMLANERLSRMLRIQSPVDTTKREFLCPLCEGLSNTVVPLLPPIVPPEERTHDNISWLTSLRKIQLKINNGLIETDKLAVADLSFLSFFKQKFLTFLRKPLSGHMNSMITVFSQATFTSGLNVQPNDEDSRIPLMVWSTCAYTIQCLEHSSRGEMKPLVEMLPKREMDVLNSLVLLANSMGSVSKPPDVINHCLRLISVLPGSEKLDDEKRSLLDIDLFDWMVKMRFSLPSIECQSVAAENLNLSSLELDVFVFHLAVVATLTQILLTTPEEIPTDEMDEFEEKDEEIAKQLSSLWRKLKDLCIQQPKPTSLQQYPQRLLRHVRCRLLPFLRCCAIYFHILNSTRVPAALKENFMSVDEEYDALSEFLALPTNLTEMFEWNDEMGIFNDDLVTKMFPRWCSNCNLDDVDGTVSSFSLESKSLTKLPDDFSELICLASNFNCPMYTRVDNRAPTMCLVCGQMLCSDAFCCKEIVHDRSVGSCTAHALKCGAGIGIFLRVRDCVVLLINGIGKGCFYASPYLDAYGETDRDLRRGNPLYLCHERYDRLKKLWKQHGIASEIARCLETNRNLLAVDWANN